MLMTAEEYVAENSHVPACYNALGDVGVLFEHTDTGYDIRFYCDISNVFHTKTVIHCETGEEFLYRFNKIQQDIDDCFIELRKIYASSITLINSLSNIIDVDTLDRYINTTTSMEIGYTHFELGEYNGEIVCFISNCREDIYETAFLTEQETVDITNLHKEWNDCVTKVSEKFETLCS